MAGKTCFKLKLLRKKISADLCLILFCFSLFAFLFILTDKNELLAKNESDSSPFVVRKLDTLEKLSDLANQDKDSHIFVFDQSNNTIVPLSSVINGNSNKRYISFKTKDLTDLELDLFKNGKNKNWEGKTLINAALIAEGIIDEQKRNDFLDRYSKISQDLKKRIVRYSDPKIRTRFVFEYMHRIILKGKYNLNLSVISEVFNAGNYNCVSATILFNALAQEVGLNAIALETTGHAKSRVLYENEFLDIETTCPRWSLLPDKVVSLSQRNVLPEPAETLLKFTSNIPMKQSEPPKQDNSKPASSAKQKNADQKTDPGKTDPATQNNTADKPILTTPSVPIKKTVTTSSVQAVKTVNSAVHSNSNPHPASDDKLKSAKFTNVSMLSGSASTDSPRTVRSGALHNGSDLDKSASKTKSDLSVSKGSEPKKTPPKTDRATADLKRSTAKNKETDFQTDDNKDHQEQNGQLVWSGNRMMREISYVQLVATIFYNSGVDYYHDQNCAKALNCYLKALQLDPHNETIWSNFKATLNNWAIQLAKDNNFPEAIQLVEIGLEIDPHFEQYRLNLPIFFLNWITKLELEQRQKEADGLKKVFKDRFPDYKEDSGKSTKKNISQKTDDQS